MGNPALRRLSIVSFYLLVVATFQTAREMYQVTSFSPNVGGITKPGGQDCTQTDIDWYLELSGFGENNGRSK